MVQENLKGLVTAEKYDYTIFVYDKKENVFLFFTNVYCRDLAKPLKYNSCLEKDSWKYFFIDILA